MSKKRLVIAFLKGLFYRGLVFSERLKCSQQKYCSSEYLQVTRLICYVAEYSLVISAGVARDCHSIDLVVVYVKSCVNSISGKMRYEVLSLPW